MRLRSSLQKRCDERVAEIPIPVPWDLDIFCRQLAERRGRPLTLLPIPAVSGSHKLCGAWIPLPEADYIFVKWNTSPWHREQIILHECAHMICDHQPSLEALTELIAQLLPSDRWDPAKVAGILLRSRHDTPQEQEAEILASLIAERTSRRSAAAIPLDLAEPADVVDVLGRWAKALGIQEQ